MTAFRSLSGDKKTHTTPRRSKGVGGSSLSRSAPASEQSAWKVLNYPSPRSRCVNYEFFQILITSIILRTGITHTHTRTNGSNCKPKRSGRAEGWRGRVWRVRAHTHARNNAVLACLRKQAANYPGARG